LSVVRRKTFLADLVLIDGLDIIELKPYNKKPEEIPQILGKITGLCNLDTTRRKSFQQ